MQSEHIRQRIEQFDHKLYLEFGGKLFDDYHASRVLPGFAPDSKLRMLMQLSDQAEIIIVISAKDIEKNKVRGDDDYHASRVLPGFAPDSKLRMLMQLSDQAEIIIVISAKDIEKNKVRGDLGITYDSDVLRLMDSFRNRGMYVGSVVITQYSGQESALLFKNRLENLHINVYIHYNIAGYPSNIPLIVSDEGYGKNEYIKTTRPLVIVTAPGPGSGKMATCLSQLYHEHKRGIHAGYAKFETFPIWNLPLKHPVNLAYEAATADLNDINMIDPFHLEAYGETTVNYNRDVEIFPVLNTIFEKIYGKSPYKSPTDMGVNMAGNCICDDEACKEASRQEIVRRVLNTIFEKIYGKSPYKSPTDMGVNMAGNCICDDEACKEASRQEIVRRYFEALNGILKGTCSEKQAQTLELLMNQAGVAIQDRKVVAAALKRAEEAQTLELLMNQAGVAIQDRKVVAAALKRAEETGEPAAAMELPDGTIITGKTGNLLGASAALLLNVLKHFARTSCCHGASRRHNHHR